MYGDVRFRDIHTLVLDIDETLVSEEGSVHWKIKERINYLLSLGVQVVVCTGRAPEATVPLTIKLGIRHYVCSNGATGHKDNILLWEKCIPSYLTYSIINWFADRKTECVLTTTDGYYATNITPAIEYASRVRKCWPEWPKVLPLENLRKETHKIQVWGAAALYESCIKSFGEYVDVLYHPNYLSIGEKGIDKGWGIALLARKWGVSTQGFLAVADDLNDIPLFRECGISIAIGKGLSQKVIDAATYWVEDDRVRAIIDVFSLIENSRECVIARDKEILHKT